MKKINRERERESKKQKKNASKEQTVVRISRADSMRKDT